MLQECIKALEEDKVALQAAVDEESVKVSQFEAELEQMRCQLAEAEKEKQQLSEDWEAKQRAFEE